MTSVIFKELESKNKKIGIAELNNPKALNALNLPMIELLHSQLRLWEKDESIAAVVLQGAGSKAFCAGGDVVGLYHVIKSYETEGQEKQSTDNEITNSLCGEFFKKEYDLDLYIHEYSKPIVVWGDGYVFGGGMGLFAGASHRITTENTIMAMPETAIGLYPEVGASWFLNKMPNNIGVFLGITGAFFNASDAKYVGLSNFNITSELKLPLIEQLCNIEWRSKKASYKQIDDVLAAFEVNSLGKMPDGNITRCEDSIVSLMTQNNIGTIYSEFTSNTYEQKWLIDAQQKVETASLLSIVLTYEQLSRTQKQSKADCFAAELNLSIRCCQFSEFAEGVRAQLVDKDRKPNWAFNQINDIEPELIDWFFSPIKI